MTSEKSQETKKSVSDETFDSHQNVEFGPHPDISSGRHPIGPETAYTAELDALGRLGGKTAGGSYAQAVDGLEQPLVALCLSGGGIRSASFGLGVLQGLARFGLLCHFDYLSTVSGGGYIGCFLTAWRHHAEDDEKVFRGLDSPAHQDGIEAPEIRGVRVLSNYLTPRVGLLSPDTWTAIVIVVRNILLNWLVFLPFFMGTLVVPVICRQFIEMVGEQQRQSLPFLIYAGIAASIVGFASASYGRRRSEAKWLTNGRFLYVVLVPLIVSSIFLTLNSAAMEAPGEPTLLYRGAALGAASYVLSSLFASLLLVLPRSSGVWKWPTRAATREAFWDLVAWTISGALVGSLIALGMELAAPLQRCGATLCDSSAGILVIAGIGWCMLSVLTGELLFVGLRSYAPNGDRDREWLARAAGWLAVTALAWLLFAAIGLFWPLILVIVSNGVAKVAALGTAAISGAVSLFLGNSSRTAAEPSQAQRTQLSLSQVASIAAVIFAIALAILVSWLDKIAFDGVAGALGVDHPDWRYYLSGGIALVVASIGVSAFVNVNRFSLHALYRNRLIRAFLGSARAEFDAASEERTRRPDPFTDFAQSDNIRMGDIRQTKLFHVINMTLNVVDTKNLAWQQRKAESFTVTPLTCGNHYLGYRPTKQYGSRGGGITLGTAMAISGAAVSPNMGSHSSALLGFLMTLFNLRLGWWLGNPLYARSSRREGPGLGLLPLLQELLGLTSDAASWVYLSDGGHFDNLGLYEMVRRRCRVIVVSDAGNDLECKLSDLGDCLRKIYIDQGVSIDFRDFNISGRRVPPVTGPYAAIADISYPGSSEKGWLLYIKPGYHGNERADVRSYAEAHPTFPHESTGEQWFNEAQLESYRALGAHITEQLCNAGEDLLPSDRPDRLSVDTFKARAEAATRRTH